MLSRNTYLEINLNNIENNVSNIIKKYNGYKYYFGVVKADCYGQGEIEPIKAIIRGGCNYLAVATLEEGLTIRKQIKDIPILCLGCIPSEYIQECIENNITVTINSLEYLKEIIKNNCKSLKIHLKINTGMNRLGIQNRTEANEAVKVIKENDIILEGIYTHIYNASESKSYEMQIEKFREITKDINLSEIEIVHIAASEALTDYQKVDFTNGCRLGIIMYGFTNKQELNLKTTTSLISEVIQIHEIKKGDTVGYNGTYMAKEEKEKIAVIPIGYADGIIRKNTGRDVYINDRKYKIVGNICMDMLFVKIDDFVNIHDKVFILKDNTHIEEVARYLDTISYEVLCSIGKRVQRIYKN